MWRRAPRRPAEAKQGGTFPSDQATQTQSHYRRGPTRRSDSVATPAQSSACSHPAHKAPFPSRTRIPPIARTLSSVPWRLRAGRGKIGHPGFSPCTELLRLPTENSRILETKGDRGGCNTPWLNRKIPSPGFPNPGLPKRQFPNSTLFKNRITSSRAGSRWCRECWPWRCS